LIYKNNIFIIKDIQMKRSELKNYIRETILNKLDEA